MLTYLYSTYPDTYMATHQILRLSNNPNILHFNIVKRIIKYLLRNKDIYLILKPDMKKIYNSLLIQTLLEFLTKYILKI